MYTPPLSHLCVLHDQKYAYCSKSAAGLSSLLLSSSISGCVPVAGSGLMIMSLLQVVNRLAANGLSGLFIYKFDASFVSTPCSKSANIKYLPQVWFSQTWWNLMRSTDLLQLVDNLQQARKIHNSHQVCGVSVCVSVSAFSIVLKCVNIRYWLTRNDIILPEFYSFIVFVPRDGSRAIIGGGGGVVYSYIQVLPD